MAITNNGLANKLPVGQLPSGYTKPTVAEFTDHESVSVYDLVVAKSTVENASTAATMIAIVAALKTQIDVILAADYIATQTVTAWEELIQMASDQRGLGGEDPWLDNTATNYLCKVKLYVKTA